MTSLESPFAASNTIFARITSQYGDVYWRDLSFPCKVLFFGQNYYQWAFPLAWSDNLLMPSITDLASLGTF